MGEGRELLALAARRGIDFRSRNREAPQRPLQSYAQCVRDFDEPLPDAPQDGVAIIDELAVKAERGLMMPTGPRFFGWVIGSSHPLGVAADWLTGAWGQNAGNHQASPAAAAAETVAARWLLELLDLPRQSSVGFVTGATVANFVCLAAARGAVLRRVGWDVEAKGLFGAPPITLIIGDDAHTTVFSALQFLGLGHDRVVRIATDDDGAIVASTFRAEIEKASGPIIAILQAGQLNTGAFDPFSEIVPAAKRAGAWVHIDGAFGLWARACAGKKRLAAGAEAADSWATDGHKWLQTPYDCGYAIVTDSEAHRRAMITAASYLPAAGTDERDPANYVPELSRRARGFATWALIKGLGRKGVAEMVTRHCAVARKMAERLGREPGVAVLNDVGLNQFVVRFGGAGPGEMADAITSRTIACVQEDGVCFVGGAKWRGRQVMRVSVIGFDTDETEGLRSADAMIEAYRSVLGAPL
jgi:glutamate/tyrosine decarboxylase-like PLP-dependent enzyme